MKNATAISHGSSRALESASEGCEEGSPIGVFLGMRGLHSSAAALEGLLFRAAS